MSVLSVLLSETAAAADTVFGVWGGLEAVKNAKTTQKQAYELKARELEYQTAQQKKATAQAAAEGARRLVNANIVEGIATFAVAALAGSILFVLAKKILRKWK
jgi:hypothetical protein